MSATIEETIGQSPLFKHLDEAWQRRLAEAAEIRGFGGGETIIEEGAQVASLFIVTAGRVRVWTRVDGRDVELKTLSAGAYFGEVSLLSGKAATASVEARTDEVSTLAIGREALLELVEQDDKVRRMLEGVTLARAKDTIGKVLK
jgi:CRP-like cAMP-binding protein